MERVLYRSTMIPSAAVCKELRDHNPGTPAFVPHPTTQTTNVPGVKDTGAGSVLLYPCVNFSSDFDRVVPVSRRAEFWPTRP